jgi:hypothetical protein
MLRTHSAPIRLRRTHAIKFSPERRQPAFTIFNQLLAYRPITSGYAMKLAEATRLQSYLNPKSIEFKLPALAARAWVGAENGSLSSGPSDTERKHMSQIHEKQDPALLSRDTESCNVDRLVFAGLYGVAPRSIMPASGPAVSDARAHPAE